MKKILLLIAICVSLSCCTYRAYTVKYSIDYSRYAKEGFLVSPIESFSSYTYTPIATVALEYGEAFGFYGEDDVTPNRILRMLVDNAKSKGANGLVNTNISRTTDNNKRPIWRASGIAVKFEKKPSSENELMNNQ